MNVISFPGLGLSFNINPVAFSIGGKDIYWYALIILGGVLAGLALAVKSAKKRGINPDYVYDVCLYGLVAAIVGARAYYVIFDFDSFRGNLWRIFQIWEGGLAIYGGLIGATLAGFIYCKLRDINFLKLADLCAPSILLGQAIGRYGNFVNAEVYGYATSLPWGMSINGAEPVHPLFLYESLWNIIGVIILLAIRDKKRAHGEVFFSYLLWYAVGRFFLEGMRNSEYILKLAEGVGVSQILSLVLVIVCIAVIIYLYKNKQIIPVDGVIFDLDGTMWDSTASLVEPWNKAFSEFGIESSFTKEDMMGVMGLSIEDIGKSFLPEKSDAERAEIMKRAVELEALSLAEHGGELYPELAKTLKNLKEDYKLFIVSNCEDGYIESFFASSGLGDMFSDYEYIGRTGKEKAENIKMIVERNGLKCAVYVGDTEKDRISAQDAGISFIHAAYGFGTTSKPTRSIKTIADLPRAVREFY